MRKNLKLLLCCLATTVAAPSFAEEATPAVTTNLSFTSDYSYRGVSQNFRNPAVQGGFDYAHSSGLFVGTWASTISSLQYTNASMEWDFYGGYSGKIGDDLGYTLGLVTVYYPGGTTNTTGLMRKFDTTEWNVGATWRGLNLKYSRTLTNLFGVSGAAGGGFEPMVIANDVVTTETAADAAGADLNSVGSDYIEANYTWALTEQLKLSAHAGYQRVKNYRKANFSDYRLGLTRDYSGFTFGLAYAKANAPDNTLFHYVSATENKRLGDGMLSLSVTRQF